MNDIFETIFAIDKVLSTTEGTYYFSNEFLDENLVLN